MTQLHFLWELSSKRAEKVVLSTSNFFLQLKRQEFYSLIMAVNLLLTVRPIVLNFEVKNDRKKLMLHCGYRYMSFIILKVHG